MTATRRPNKGSGWIAFAGIMLIIAGVINTPHGIAMLAWKNDFAAWEEALFEDDLTFSTAPLRFAARGGLGSSPTPSCLTTGTKLGWTSALPGTITVAIRSRSSVKSFRNASMAAAPIFSVMISRLPDR